MLGQFAMEVKPFLIGVQKYGNLYLKIREIRREFEEKLNIGIRQIVTVDYVKLKFIK